MDLRDINGLKKANLEFPNLSLPLPGLADGSLAAEPGGDNSTQKITVEKQQAVHYSSVAMP